MSITIQLLSGHTFSIHLDQDLTQRQFYRMIYHWILPEEIRPPHMWQMMLLQDEEWIRPNQEPFQAQDGETLYLLIDPRSYEMEFEYEYVAKEKNGRRYDAIQFKIRDDTSTTWHRQMFYVIQADPLSFYHPKQITEIGISSDFTRPICFHWPIPADEIKIGPVSQDTPIHHRLDILLDDLDLSASAREHLNQQIQQRWDEWISKMDESEQEHIQQHQEWERQQERGMDW